MSSSSQRAIDEGASGLRAGGAPKRPSPPPKKQQRSNLGPSPPSSGSTSRHSGDDSTTDSGSVSSSFRQSTCDSTSAATSNDAKWSPSSTQILLDRTLRLHTLSPLHFSSLPASIQEVSRPLFSLLRAELQTYINMRLSEGFGFLESSGTVMNARVRDVESDDLRPLERRRRAEMDRVGGVRIGFLQDSDFIEALQRSNTTGEAKARPWVIEIELGKPAAAEQAKINLLRFKAAQQATPAELCHIILFPASNTKDQHSRTSRRYPLVVTKAPSASIGTGDPLLGGTAVNVGPTVLNHALDWIQKRFDCRLSSSNGGASIASQLRGIKLEELAELIVRQTRIEMVAAEHKTIEGKVKPVELVFGFPTKVNRVGGKATTTTTTMMMMQGPAPDLTNLSLTVPWEICIKLLEGSDENEEEVMEGKQPLLPALNHYLSMHTSIPLDVLELNRIGVAGINVGSGRIKISKMPANDGASENKKSLLKRARGEDDGQSEGEAGDRRRAGSVFAFLRRIVEDEHVELG
ncbi:uncharacterized protein MEPE_01961 [Melanopsichium pennsylvanicum]|uniref:Uncharacterized protein n=2 Tax=Melanopsichium pennsylvanicum TaxID=63383 RepID=A0AAJ4XIQ0_9BASI|nr:putative protein [Melanopsichium pennsylvanicum 4]SNX83255.1 uncharacterized protein MEPE_01961 [Melanopsichium pennsylvanicum]